MIKEAISRVVCRRSLSQDEAYQTMLEIMEGKATSSQIASYITALRMKGETIAEITGSAKAMREKAVYINPSSDIALDTCGTGGDGLGLFNISTISAFVIAGCGVVIAKHGNRSVSSQCGSADLLIGLSVNINIPKEGIEKCLKEIGIGFLFAPNLHPAMKYAISPRREIGIRSIFNILGPLCNPARVRYQVLGVYDERLCKPLANVLRKLGTVSAIVLHSYDGADEATLYDTKIVELYNGKIKEYTISPLEFRLKKCDLSELRGGDVSENLKIALDILSGKEMGPKRDVVLLNSAIGLYVVRRASSIPDGIKLAEDSISSGSASFKLNELKRISQEYPSS